MSRTNRPNRPQPDTFSTVLMIFVIAAGMAAVAQAQETSPTQQSIQELEVLLGQYDQGGYENLPPDPRLTAAEDRIIELEAELKTLREAHAALQATHAACGSRP